MKNLAKKYKFLIIFLVIIILLGAGSFVFLKLDGNKSAGDGAQYVIGISIPDLSDPWQFQMYKDILEEAEKHSNVNIVFNDSASSINKQQQHINNLIIQKADIIIIMPVDPEAIAEKMQMVVKRDIPVIIMQRAVDCDYTSFIFTDNYKIGYAAGEHAKQLLGENGGRILEIQGDPYSYESLQRKAGFNDAIKGTTLKREYVLVGNWLRDVAYQRLLTEDHFFNPSPDLVFAHNDTMGIGAYMAASEKGLRLKIIGVDSLPGRNLGLEALQNGMLTASIENLTGGKEAIQTAMNILNGIDVQKNQEIPIAIITD